MAGHVGVETPAGWSFHEKPHRHYQLHGSRTVPNIQRIAAGDGTVPDELEILSVTQALGIIDKSGPLQGYAAKMTLSGVARILREFGLQKDSDGLLPKWISKTSV